MLLCLSGSLISPRQSFELVNAGRERTVLEWRSTKLATLLLAVEISGGGKRRWTG